MNVYEIVTNKIIEKLQSGTVPWHRPWNNNGSAVNWKTQKAYRGINAFLLENGEYATYKQITESGGTVKKGEKSQVVVFWKWLDKENTDTGEKERIPMLRYYNVFEINTQVEGLKSKRKSTTFEHSPVDSAELVVQGYADCPKIIKKSGDGAFYVPALDYIQIPPMDDFPVLEEYYSTLFHEMVHSTGHESRLNRDGITKKASFGSEVYSKEELVAEMGASMLCGHCNMDMVTLDNSASYIASWLRVLKEDSRMVVTAASQAQKAADHILGVKFDEKSEA